MYLLNLLFSLLTMDGGETKMKKIIFIVGALLILFVSGCGKGKFDPTESLDTYLEHWKKNEFAEMYKMLDDVTTDTYSTEDFVDRYEKVYKDLDISNVHINYSPLTDETLEQIQEEKAVTVPLEIEMDSIAGAIQFTSEIGLLFAEHESDEGDPDWLVEWTPDLIFPNLADGGKIKFETEAPKRGEILDRNLMPLAINDIAYEIGVVPNRFQNKAVEIEQLANHLQISVSRIEEALNASWVQDDYFVPLRTISKHDDQKITQLTAIPSVVTKETTGRTYPAGKAAAHLVGYVGQITTEELKELPQGKYNENDVIGKRGLEKQYEEKLKGEAGKKILVISEDENGKEQTTVLAEKPVRNGENIQLTIDVNLQEDIFKSYDNKLSGTAAAIHPTTGEVLALVSSPAFDPTELTYGITRARWDTLMNDKAQPFVNRFTAKYAPGSVIKPVIAAVGLANGTITHEQGIEINGLTWKKESWSDFHITRVSTGNNPVTVKDALVRSDNIFFARKAIEMGSKSVVNGLKDFGFDEKLPINYPISASQISNSGKLEDEVLRANTGYGQGEIEVSSLHMALMYTPFLNDGNLVKPVLLADEKQGEIWKKDLLSKEDSEKMQEYLRAIVTDGTAKIANDKDFPISGKTGTAELKLSLDSKGHENGWFVGYPTDNQDIIVAMMMEKVENLGTSSLVAEKVLHIMKQYAKD